MVSYLDFVDVVLPEPFQVRYAQSGGQAGEDKQPSPGLALVPDGDDTPGSWQPELHRTLGTLAGPPPKPPQPGFALPGTPSVQ